MEVRICPICDAKVNGINFCPICKRFVKPREMSQNFYLNERRENREYTYEDMIYPDCHMEGNLARQQSGFNKRNGASKAKSKKRRVKDQSRNIRSVAVLLFWFAMIIVIWKKGDYKFEFDFGYDDSDYEVSEENTVTENTVNMDDTYGVYEKNISSDNTSVKALSEQEAEADGKACTMYGHYEGMKAADFIDNLLRCSEENDVSLLYNKSAGYKRLEKQSDDNFGYTCYELCDVFSTTLLAKEAVAVYYDYNTNQLHGIYLYATVNEKKDGSDIIPMYDSVIEALDDKNLLGAEKENVYKYVNEYLTQITQGTNSFADSDNMMIYIGQWNICIGRAKQHIFIQMSAADR